MKKFRVIVLFMVCGLVSVANAQSNSGQLKSDIEKFAKDLKTDLSNSQVTPQELQTFEAALETALATAHKPDPAYVAALRSMIKSAAQDGTITPSEKLEIQKEIGLVISSAGVSEADAIAVKNAGLAIWKSSNFTRAEGRQLLMDARAILNDLPTPPKP